jgi:hypothetical protein
MASTPNFVLLSSLKPLFSMALNMRCASRTTLEPKTPESNKSVGNLRQSRKKCFQLPLRCFQLPLRDAMAVVNPELCVHGIAGLRVADAAIMPTVVSGTTNAATIMIGERIADLVREQLRLAA